MAFDFPKSLMAVHLNDPPSVGLGSCNAIKKCTVLWNNVSSYKEVLVHGHGII